MTYRQRTSFLTNRSCRLLTQTPCLDALLAFLTYTLTLLAALLPRTSQPARRLAGLLSDTRMALRLFGLIHLYAAAIKIWGFPSMNRDWVLKWIERINVAAGLVFQVAENTAFLGDKGVLGKRRGGWGKWWAWSSRAWAVSVVGEIGRLGRERWLVDTGAKGDKMNGVSEVEQKEIAENNGGALVVGRKREIEEKAGKWEEMKEEKWWREMVVNVAYAPMTLHWSFGERLLSEGTIGTLGVVVGGLGLREAWKRTA